MFKVGDRVVNVANQYLGAQDWTGEIIEVRTTCVRIKADRGSNWNESNLHELMLEEIYNSPLYKAMQEEE